MYYSVIYLVWENGPPWKNATKRRWTFKLNKDKKFLDPSETRKVMDFICHPKVDYLMGSYHKELMFNEIDRDKAPDFVEATNPF